LTGFLYSGLC